MPNNSIQFNTEKGVDDKIYTIDAVSLNKYRNYAVIYSFTMQSFLLTINKGEIIREENIKTDTRQY